MEKVLCLGCMQEKEQRPVCEHCGFDERTGNHPHQLPVGTILQNQYLIGRVLGQGGFGITYEALDCSTGRHVAIKELFIKEICNREKIHFLFQLTKQTHPHSILIVASSSKRPIVSKLCRAPTS